MAKKRTRKIRINITMKPELLKKVDVAAGDYERSSWISEACVEKVDKPK